ncbi:MAG: carbon-nitrogen hydrolase family protein [Clostridia bacterium]|nr:carbon-nitrogen hydrolase family protein [Clostridia bacterium]
MRLCTRKGKIMHVRIALLQLLAEDSPEHQKVKGAEACRQARAAGADIALFPEMWNTGYRIPGDREGLAKWAVYADDPWVQDFGVLAGELNMAIGITYLEKSGTKVRNAITLFDRKGRECLRYAKVHTCDFDAESVLTAGEEFPVCTLALAEGTVQAGCMICFDREFPESARILMLKGAELILAPNACPMEINRLSALRTRAYENMLAVATCNYPLGQPDCNGHSTVFDGVAWLRDAPGVRDMCILEAPEEEGIYCADLDMDQLRMYRSAEVMGCKYRHPDVYGLLSIH